MIARLMVAGALALASIVCIAQTTVTVPPPAPGRSSAPVRELPDAELVQRLRAGGLTIYFRHVTTDFSRNDTQSRGSEDCANQRPLVDAGREDARAIAAAIRKLAIPIGEVLASPTCRTVETATLIFGRAKPEIAVRGGFPDGNPDRWRALREMLAIKPAAGNRAIASHGNPIFAVAGAPYLGEGEAVIIAPTRGDFEVIARLRRGDWERLAEPVSK